MAGTVVAVFDQHEAAEKAAEVLLKAGIAFGDISLVCKDAGGEKGDAYVDRNHPADDHEEFISRGFREVARHDIEQLSHKKEDRAPLMIAGIVAGMPLGALAVACGVVYPPLGAVIMSAPIAAMLIGATVGSIIGVIVGGLLANGFPDDAARYYHDQVGKGATLIAILAGRKHVEQLKQILEQSGGHDFKFFTRFVDTLQSVES